MAQKNVNLPGIGNVVIAKRRGTKNLRLSIKPDGQVRVGLPSWAPYSAGIKFALGRADWILQNRNLNQPFMLKHGHRIGKSHRLYFVPVSGSSTTSSRLSQNKVIVSSHLPLDNPIVQRRAGQACERALKKEAQKLLTYRLDELAKKHGFTYKQIRIKHLASRWGSCSHGQVITLNYYLVQLPWQLIDYVILHELVHTRHLNHSQQFWKAFEEILPGAKSLRRDIKNHKPVLQPV